MSGFFFVEASGRVKVFCLGREQGSEFYLRSHQQGHMIDTDSTHSHFCDWLLPPKLTVHHLAMDTTIEGCSGGATFASPFYPFWITLDLERMRHLSPTYPTSHQSSFGLTEPDFGTSYLHSKKPRVDTI